jgi:hypothetical protein
MVMIVVVIESLDELAAVKTARQRPKLGRSLQGFCASLRRVGWWRSVIGSVVKVRVAGRPCKRPLWLALRGCAGWAGVCVPADAAQQLRG